MSCATRAMREHVLMREQYARTGAHQFMACAQTHASSDFKDMAGVLSQESSRYAVDDVLGFDTI